MKHKKNILFICSWNSCRSQMAEGLAREMAGDDFEIRSAGINAGGVNGDAIESMKEIGLDISEHTSDRLTQTHFIWVDYIVTVCDSAKEQCLTIPTEKTQIHWSIADPYGNFYTEEEKFASFAKVRETLRENITGLFERIRSGEI
jgi:arsenate reductase (thioredoxin)